jgi:hypothetical protein
MSYSFRKRTPKQLKILETDGLLDDDDVVVKKPVPKKGYSKGPLHYKPPPDNPYVNISLRDAISRSINDDAQVIPIINWINDYLHPTYLFDIAFLNERRYDVVPNLNENVVLSNKLSYQDAYNLYLQEYDSIHDIKDVPYNPDVKAPQLQRRGILKFPIKHNLKKYGKHHVSPRGSYEMDILFSNPDYLVVIGIVSRYLFVVPLNLSSDGKKLLKMTKDEETVERALFSIIPKLNKNNDSTEYFKTCIISDAEKAFQGANLSHWLYLKHISIRPKADNERHTHLSIINRIIRTIRDYFYSHFNLENQFPPHLMERFVYLYNNTYHKFLSKVIGFKCSPEMVEKDESLEAEIADRIYLLNSEVPSRKIEKGTEYQKYMAPDTSRQKVRKTVDDNIYEFEPERDRTLPAWMFRTL